MQASKIDVRVVLNVDYRNFTNNEIEVVVVNLQIFEIAEVMIYLV